ncbi:MAG: TolC family protein [Chitinophagales bacterium]|nr:TolC family protein [Chitinophagales bacterium]
MNKYTYILLMGMMYFIYPCRAQILTPEEAVSVALSKNFDIVLAKQAADIAETYDTKANAGMLPVINLTTGDVFNLNNINQKFTTGQEVVKNWVPVNSFSAGVNMNWTVFDGLKMYATKERLEQLALLGDLQVKQQVQNTVAEVLQQYYEVVRQKQQITALKVSLEISAERVKLAQAKFDVGYSDKTPLLQAKVDLSAQQVSLNKQETLLEQSKIMLNQLLGRDPLITFDVVDTIVIQYVPNITLIQDSISTNNYSIQQALKNIEILQLERKEINAQKLPRISLSSGYNFSQNNSKAGLQLFNRSYGPTVGVSASIPLFNGGLVKNQLEISSINIASQQIELEQVKNNLSSTALMTYKAYENAMTALKLNEENVGVAKENVVVTMERLRLNQANTLEIKQAQSSYEQAMYNVILARYEAKMAEINLRKLLNNLIQ